MIDLYRNSLVIGLLIWVFMRTVGLCLILGIIFFSILCMICLHEFLFVLNCYEVLL